MGVSSPWEGACRQAGDASRMVLREGKQLCLPAAVAAAVVPPLKGRGGTAVGELMWVAKRGTVLEFRGAVVAILCKLQGLLLK